jgi:hypothetical protein
MRSPVRAAQFILLEEELANPVSATQARNDCAPGAQGLGASISSSTSLWAVLGFRLALPQSLHAFSARARRRSILSSRRHPIEQKHEPRATLLSGIRVVQRVQ